MQRFSEKVSFIWSVADLLRGDFKQSDYCRGILPFTVLRRLDQVLTPTREAARTVDSELADSPYALREQMLLRAAGQSFYNRSKLDFDSLLADPPHLAQNLASYLHGLSQKARESLEHGLSQNARDILERFRFENQVERLDRAGLLFLVTQKLAGIDLHPDRVANLEMGYIFEELIWQFSEQSNETAGEHFTHREVIRLIVRLLLSEDTAELAQCGTVTSMYDPDCGRGGMLSLAPAMSFAAVARERGRPADQAPSHRPRLLRADALQPAALSLYGRDGATPAAWMDGLARRSHRVR